MLPPVQPQQLHIQKLQVLLLSAKIKKLITGIQNRVFGIVKVLQKPKPPLNTLRKRLRQPLNTLPPLVTLIMTLPAPTIAAPAAQLPLPYLLISAKTAPQLSGTKTSAIGIAQINIERTKPWKAS